MRRILSVLEEAGEDDLAALVNTAMQGAAAHESLPKFVAALSELAQDDVLTAARVRNEATGGWEPLSRNDTLGILNAAASSLEWSERGSGWRWRRDVLRVQILLTPAGLELARGILRGLH